MTRYLCFTSQILSFIKKVIDGMIIEINNKKIMEDNKERKPTDEALKNFNPSDRDFQRTEKQTDRVDQSEIEEQKREKEKQKDK